MTVPRVPAVALERGRSAMRPAAVVPRRRTALYLGLTLLMGAAAIAGFWPQYYGRLLAGDALAPRVANWAVHVHSALFVGWLVLAAAQSQLVRVGRADLHRRLGAALALYGAAAGGGGLWAALVLAARHVATGDAPERGPILAMFGVTDVLMFGGFLAAACVYRRRPEAHKRLMVLATWSIALVGFGRLLTRAVPVVFAHRWWLAPPFFVLPVLAGIAHDWRTRRRVHPVWWVGLALFALRNYRPLLNDWPPWIAAGRALVRPFL